MFTVSETDSIRRDPKRLRRPPQRETGFTALI